MFRILKEGPKGGFIQTFLIKNSFLQKKIAGLN
jgi:hypothetical protein